MENYVYSIYSENIIMKSLQTRFIGVFLLFTSTTFAQSEKNFLPPPPPPPITLPAPPKPPLPPAEPQVTKLIPPAPPPPPLPSKKEDKEL